ncbi:hypothetical protein DID76_04045 [Candidatus Marinamargulisbacteria bacterium SCGC AG-414-C22]|nr:hypothetical protein DID76_04045 [Candidatus Marinamargulisbacteria bacterium SCGC AG-414-C22]
MIKKQFQLVWFIGISVVLFILLRQYLTLEFLQTNKDVLLAFYQQHPMMTVSLYVCSYVVLASVGLPVPALWTVFSGYLFGTVWGIVWSAIAFTLHCTLTLLLARYWLRDFVQKRFKKTLAPINEGIERSGVYYLFFLRVSFGVPTFWTNCGCALTYMHIVPFLVVSVTATLPMLYILASSGKLLGEITSMMQLFDVENIVIVASLIVISLILIGINHQHKKKVEIGNAQ